MMDRVTFIKTRFALYIVLLFGVSACMMADESAMVNEKTVFQDITNEAGLNMKKDSYSHCWGDFNGDRFMDLLVINHIEPPLLFLNDGNNTFKDMTVFSTIKRGGDHHGCAIADYDNDGDADIYVTVGAQRGRGQSPNRLYQNNGEGQFTDVASKVGISSSKGRGRSVSWIDYDKNGHLDLFVANAKREDAPAALYKNLGNGRFMDASAESGLNIVDTLSEASWVDYNNDGFMDLTSVSSRRGRKWEIALYLNDQKGAFNKTMTFSGWTYAWGDYDNDGDMDLFASTPPRVYLMGYELGMLSRIIKGENKLYENRGGGRFSEVSNKAGLSDEMGGDKAVFIDYDNDGDLDLYLLVSGALNENINDIVFENLGNGTFKNSTAKAIPKQEFKGRGCGVAVSDFNNDGFQDLFLTNGRGPYRDTYETGRDAGPYVLYKNTGSDNHWMKVDLEGTNGNKDGIGAQVRLYTGGGLQYRQNNGGMEGYVQHSRIMHFGLGSASGADRIEVIWPGGSVSTINNVKADRTLLIRENNDYKTIPPE